MKHRNLLAMLPVLAVGMCQHADVGSILGGECKLVHSPQYAVLGRTSYDQIWINQTTEAVVTGCNQDRPKVRPASLDAPKKAAVTAAAPKVKPKGRLRRWFGV